MPLTLITTGVAVGAIAVAVFLWIVSVQRRLTALDEGINNAMIQIGLQLSCRFDAAAALLEQTQKYAKNESETLITAVKSKRADICAKSTPDDVQRLEEIISEVLRNVYQFREQYPQLKVDQNFTKTLDAVETYENMLRTSRLIYNNSVNKLNSQIRLLPVSIIAGMMGFSERRYI